MPHSAAAVGLRHSNTSGLLPGCLRGNKSWPETRASKSLAGSGREPSRGAAWRFENPFAGTPGRQAQPRSADPGEPSRILPRRPVSIRSIFPGARGLAPPGNQVLGIDRPGLGQAWRPPPSRRHPRHVVPPAVGLPDSGGTPANRGSIPRLEIGSHGLWENQQHPVAVRPPFLFEIRALHAEKLAAPRIVEEDRPALPIDAGYHHIV